MKFITKIICVLRSAIAEIGSLGKISRLSHLAAFPPCETTDFYRLGVHKEEILTAVHLQGNPLTYGFAQPCGFLPAVIELPARYEIGDLFLVFLQLVIKKPFLAIELSDSAAKDNATTSKSENFGTGPQRTIFPWSLTRLLENCLHISSILTNFVYKLCIR